MTRSKYLPMSQVQKAIKGQFVNLVQYRQYVKINNLQAQGFPLNPSRAYRGEYSSIDEFLGNRLGTYFIWQSNDVSRRKLWLHAQNKILKEAEKSVQIQHKPQYHGIVELYQGLLTHNASSNTLSSFIKDVNPNPDQLKQLIDLMIEHSKRNQKITA